MTQSAIVKLNRYVRLEEQINRAAPGLSDVILYKECLVNRSASMITCVPSSTSGSTLVLLTMVIWSGLAGLLAQDSLSSPTDPFWSDFGGEDIKEREACKPAALSEDVKEREACKSAAWSRGPKEREAHK